MEINDYKALMEQSEPSSALIQKTKRRMRAKISKPNSFKRYIGVAATAAAFIFVLSFGVIHADAIKGFIKVKLSMEFENDPIVLSDIAYIEIANDVPINKENGMTLSEVKNLGFNILVSDLTTSDWIGYGTSLAKNRIARIDLWYPAFVEYQNEENKCIDASMRFLTQYADEAHILPFEGGIDASGGKQIENVYHIKTLDVDAVLYGNDWSDERLTAAFVYENILYTFIGSNISEGEMIGVLESLR